MIRLARWVPLSLAIHAATLGGVWRMREVAEPALFVDMTLTESETPSGRESSPGPPARVPAGRRPPARGAAAASSPAPRVAASPPDGGASARAPAPPISAAPSPPPPPAPSAAVASPPPAPSEVVATPAVSSPPTVAPTHDAAPVAPTDSAPSASQSSAASPADVFSPSATHGSHAPVPSTAYGGGAADSTASNAARQGLEAGAGEVRSGTAGSGAGTSGEGPLALAIPGDGGAGVYGPYLSALRRRLQESLEYPTAARRRGLSGTVHLEIAIDATGRLGDVLLVRSSSHALLDDAALQAARSLRRVPFPPDVRPRPLRVLLPVVFDLR